jgi:hypothetical protein
MQFKQAREPARTIYRVDRTLSNGAVHEYYGAEVYDSRYLAERAICLRFHKYRDQMSIIEVHEPTHTVLISQISL